MRNLRLIFLTFILFIILTPFILAQNHQYHTKLLAVEDRESGLKGSIADLYLELREGTGRVFIDTFPLTKFDTQISTRFAKEIACDHLDLDCSNYDFIYTIKADSSLIGGPSAGAATTLLTIAALQDINLDKGIAITGTINSGGFIGPVGGIKEKIEGAKDKGITKVLIPKGKRFVTEEEDLEVECDAINCIINKTEEKEIDLVEFGKTLGIEVLEVGNLDSAWYEFTGIKQEEINEEISVNNEYTEVMKDLAATLCERSNNLSLRVDMLDNQEVNITDLRSEIKNLTKKSEKSLSEEDFYSSASFCFGANVKAREAILRLKRLKNKDLIKEINRLNKVIDDFDQTINQKEITTITDLETYMIVKERLIEAKDTLNESLKKIKDNEDPLSSLAYGYERIYSAYSWSKFFGIPGKTFNFDKEALKNSCLNKISEVEERYQYVQIFFPKLEFNRKELERAYEDLKNQDFELCLFKASKAKAEVDVILSAVGIETEKIDELINEKTAISNRFIAKQIRKGVFPILGYSYFEYADSLKDSDKYSALLYLEYALELSSLDIYFEGKEETKLRASLSQVKLSDLFYLISVAVLVLVAGIIIGVVIGTKIKGKEEHKSKTSVKKKKTKKRAISNKKIK